MKSHHVLWIIALGVFAWGVYHAAGAYFNFRVAGEPVQNPWRPVVVAACVLGFLGFWGAMLLARRARLKDKGPRRLGPRDAC